MPYKSHEALKEPVPTQQLWRYMDFAKFTAILQNKNLYFSALNQFSLTDPWEGLPSNLNFQAAPPSWQTMDADNLPQDAYIACQNGTALYSRKGDFSIRRMPYVSFTFTR